MLTRVVTYGDDKIENNVTVFVPGFAACAGSIDSKVFLQHPDRIGIYCRSGVSAGAVRLESAFAAFANKILSENAASGVPCTQEQDFKSFLSDHCFVAEAWGKLVDQRKALDPRQYFYYCRIIEKAQRQNA